jgi:hypothetical protein
LLGLSLEEQQSDEMKAIGADFIDTYVGQALEETASSTRIEQSGLGDCLKTRV